MKRYLFLLLTPLLVWSKPHIITSISPVAHLASVLCADGCEVSSLIPAGASPHHYEPKPSDIKAVAAANYYLDIDLSFDRHWRERFVAKNPKLTIVSVAQKIKRRQFLKGPKAGKGDPHIWLSFQNLDQLSREIAHKIILHEPSLKAKIEKNLALYLQKLNTAKKRSLDLMGQKSGAFMVTHPSWGYLAAELGLEQLPALSDEKILKPKALLLLNREVKHLGIKAVVATKGFDRQLATKLTAKWGLCVGEFAPLRPDTLKLLEDVVGFLAACKAR